MPAPPKRTPAHAGKMAGDLANVNNEFTKKILCILQTLLAILTEAQYVRIFLSWSCPHPRRCCTGTLAKLSGGGGASLN